MTAFELFDSIGEPFAAGLFELEGASPMVRHANALKRFFEQGMLPPYLGGQLYPAGKCMFTFDGDLAVKPHYANTMAINGRLLKRKSVRAFELIKAEDDLVVKFHDSPHTVGGMGWTHSFPNYSRVLNEGLDRYAERVHALEEGDFREAMLILLEGIRIYHQRCIDHLVRVDAPVRLIEALRRVPYEPARDIYEAMVCLNFIFYLDGCDDIGPLDRILLPYYRGEDMTPLFREFFKNVDVNDGWSGTLGPDYNELTRMCLRAIHNGRRPNLQLLVKRDMPDWVWEEAVASLATSCGQPALYNYELYLKTLRERMPQIPEEDLKRIAFGGCTETMFEGLSAVGSDDAGINVALIFSDYLRRELSRRKTYDEFYEGLVTDIRREIADTLDRLNEYRRTRALYRPDVMRTLLVDDCLDTLTEFHAGGARYMYSVINMAGAINVIDSLNVIRELVYEKQTYMPLEFLSCMDERDPQFLDLAKRCASYGNDDDRADSVGTRFLGDLAEALEQRACYPRGKFYPVSNQFITYVPAGKQVPATPDGRAAGAPLCDSLSAIHGNDYKGATALLNSVSKLGLHRVIGTPIVNIRISKKHLTLALKPLVLSFFENGGMQLQVSCLSREEILDAIAHPEEHRSLVVRVGGYSEYFNRLSPELQQTVLERTEY